MSEYIKIPYYSLKPNSLTIFERAEFVQFSAKHIETFKNLDDNTNKYNELSENSRKRMRNAIDFLLYISRNQQLLGTEIKSKNLNTEIELTHGRRHKRPINYKLTFITLTLSAEQEHTDEEIKAKLLNQFLTVARTKWNMQYYIWKAEKQENGNIHFHILTNTYIKHQELRKEWNQIQNKKGFSYVDKYSCSMQEFFKDGFKKFPGDKRQKKTQYKAYLLNRAISWTNPNSTDIHALYKVKNISAYMSKYMSKSVTKTERVLKMQEIITELEKLQEQKSANEIQLCFDDDLDNIQTSIESKIQYLETQLEKLKEKGVSGRIWGQSQKLSKLKNFTDVQPFEHIPDIQQVEKTAEYKQFVEVGSSQILTYKFDITKTKELKGVLDKHIADSLKEV